MRHQRPRITDVIGDIDQGERVEQAKKMVTDGRAKGIEFIVPCDSVIEDGTTVDPVVLVESGILKNVQDGIRILGNGELTKKLTVRANGFTKSAEEKITAAGGKVEVI